MDNAACNYDANATEEDGSLTSALYTCDYTLTVEAAPAVTAGLTTYRFFVDMQDATDHMSAVFGNDQASCSSTLWLVPLTVLSTVLERLGHQPCVLACVPRLGGRHVRNGWLDRTSTSGIAGAADPSIVEDVNQPVTPYFLTPGATNLESTTLTGASWYVLNTAENGLPDANLQVLIMQVTTAGDISGQINFQVFPLGVGADQEQLSIAFEGAGTFGAGANEPACGCTDEEATNYDETGVRRRLM